MNNEINIYEYIFIKLVFICDAHPEGFMSLCVLPIQIMLLIQKLCWKICCIFHQGIILKTGFCHISFHTCKLLELFAIVCLTLLLQLIYQWFWLNSACRAFCFKLKNFKVFLLQLLYEDDIFRRYLVNKKVLKRSSVIFTSKFAVKTFFFSLKKIKVY